MCFVFMLGDKIDFEENVKVNYIHTKDACQKLNDADIILVVFFLINFYNFFLDW